MKLFGVLIMGILSMSSHASCLSDLENGYKEFKLGNEYYNQMMEIRDDVLDSVELEKKPSVDECQNAISHLDLVWKSSYHYYVASVFGQSMNSSICAYKTSENQNFSNKVMVGSAINYNDVISLYHTDKKYIKTQCDAFVTIPDLGLPSNFIKNKIKL